MRPLKTISMLCFLLYLPLYAEGDSTSIPIVEVGESYQPIVEEPKPPIQELEPINIQPSPSDVIEKPTLQELLTQVKEAPDEQKRVLMNQLKVQLKTMNKESRQQAMIELKKSFANKNIHPTGQEQPNHEGCQHGNHQPKFRHLQQGTHDGSGPHQGAGRAGQQGNGQK